MPVSSLERLDALMASPATRSKRMLVIANPYATTMSDPLKDLVHHALRRRYEVEAVDTQRRGHATDLSRDAAAAGYDVVVAFGGDGTVNEVANGLVGSQTPLSVLPGGATNVYCRMLGIPNDVVDATEHLLDLADDLRPRAVDVASVNGRTFTFSAGVGLDASVVRLVDEHPRLKARLGPWYFAQAGISTFLRHYLVRPPRLAVRTADGRTLAGVSAFVQNAAPYTYFRRRPVHLADDAGLDSGEVTGVVLTRAGPLDIPTVIFRALSDRARIARHSKMETFQGRDLRVVSTDERPLPVQVDGDYIGDHSEAVFSVAPGALRVVA
ncbi:MAG: diacylglycerol kinase family lipid kinase [Solirubrobacterales bacterium]|nr:diacylglycerol kinase family lipid kinase [Solirubrobacterales bacterium]